MMSQFEDGDSDDGGTQTRFDPQNQDDDSQTNHGEYGCDNGDFQVTFTQIGAPQASPVCPIPPPSCTPTPRKNGSPRPTRQSPATPYAPEWDYKARVDAYPPASYAPQMPEGLETDGNVGNIRDFDGIDDGYAAIGTCAATENDNDDGGDEDDSQVLLSPKSMLSPRSGRKRKWTHAAVGTTPAKRSLFAEGDIGNVVEDDDDDDDDEDNDDHVNEDEDEDGDNEENKAKRQAFEAREADIFARAERYDEREFANYNLYRGIPHREGFHAPDAKGVANCDYGWEFLEELVPTPAVRAYTSRYFGLSKQAEARKEKEKEAAAAAAADSVPAVTESGGGESASGGGGDVMPDEDEELPDQSKGTKSSGGAASNSAAGDESDSVSPFGPARQMLQLSAVPSSLPCREDEFDTIAKHIRGCLRGSSSQGLCLYISGVPGSGKTATVLSVVRSLKEEVAEKLLSKFNFLHINAMKLSKPQKLYSELWQGIKGKRCSDVDAADLLEGHFTYARNASSNWTVVLVDEMDLLITPKQTVLYNICDWPTRDKSRLIILGIANTMNLPERLLPRIASRLGINRQVFHPYTSAQLNTIIRARLESIEAFTEEAIRFSAIKVAALYGDARRALQLCCRASYIAEARILEEKENAPSSSSSSPPLVLLADVQKAIKEMSDNIVVNVVSTSSSLERVFLCCVVKELESTGLAEASFLKIHSRYQIMCTQLRMREMHLQILLDCCNRLCGCGVLHSRGRCDVLQSVQVRVNVDDVDFALRSDEFFTGVLQNDISMTGQPMAVENK